MSHPWPFEPKRHASRVRVPARGIIFEGLENRVLLSAEIGIPPPDLNEALAVEPAPVEDTSAQLFKAASLSDSGGAQPSMLALIMEDPTGTRYIYSDDDVDGPATAPDPAMTAGTDDALDFSAVTADLRFTIGTSGITVENIEDPDNPVTLFSDATGIEHLIGGSGDDIFVFEDLSAGLVSILGGDGIDTLDYSAVSDAIEVDLATGQASGVAGTDSDPLPGAFAVQGVENLIASSGGTPAPSGAADEADIRGSGDDNRFESGAGDDDFAGGAGDDEYVFADGWGDDRVRETSGAGTDTLDFSAVTSGLTFTGDGLVDGESGWRVVDTADGSTPSVLATHVDVLVGSSDDDVFTGGPQDTVYRFGAGDDSGWGEDQITGGAGIETLDFSRFDGNLIFNLGAAGVAVFRDDDGDGIADGAAVVTASNIDNIVGGRGDNTFVLENGLAWAGSIRGSFGGRNTLDYSGWDTGVSVDLQDGTASGIAGGAFDIHNVIGGTGDDVLRGNVLDNEITGRGGNDTIDGREGTDTVRYDYVSNDPTHQLTLDLAAGTASVAVPLPAEDADTLASIENVVGSPNSDIIYGDAGANVLAGGGGDDQIDGRDGDDTLSGGAGNDALTGGAGNDTISYRDAGTVVTVDLGNAAAQDTGEGSDTLDGLENVIGPGFDAGSSGFASSFTGTAGANRFYVAAGNTGDTRIAGGGGADEAVVDARGNTFTVPSSPLTSLTVQVGSVEATISGLDSVSTVLVQSASRPVSAEQMTELGEHLGVLADRIELLESTGAFGVAIPLADPGGSGFGELLEFGRVLRRLADDFAGQFSDDGIYQLSDTNDIRAFFADWEANLAREGRASLEGTREWIAQTLDFTDRLLLDSNGNVTELRLHQRLQNSRLTFIDISESEVLRDSGIAAVLGSGFELVSGFELDFEFGLESFADPSASEFFVQAGPRFEIDAFAELRVGQSPELGALERMGFLGADTSATIATLTHLSARASAGLPGPGGDDRISGAALDLMEFAELGSAQGSIDADLPFESAERLDATDGDDAIGLGTPADNFFVAPIVPDLSDFGADFTLATPAELLRMLGQLGDWLDALGQTEFLDLTIPFAGSTTLGDVLGFGQAFGEEMLRYLTRHDGLQLAGEAAANGRLTDDPTDARLVTFIVAVQPEDGAEIYLPVQLRAGETAFNASAEDLRAQIEQALIAGAAVLGANQRALAEEIEVELAEGRIVFRPIAGAREVVDVSLPQIGNESLGFDGRRLVAPRSLLAEDLFGRDHVGTLGHELELTLNVDGNLVTATVLRDAANDSIGDLIADIEAAVTDALGVALPGTTLEVSARLADGDRIEFTAVDRRDLADPDDDRAVQVVLTEVREPSVLIPGRLSLGVETASFPTAQLLAEQLEAIINRLFPDDGPLTLAVDFDVASGEISLRVDLERTFDVFSVPFDFGVDLGDFVTVEAASALGLTAMVDLGFEFGVDLTPQTELVVAPPVFQPDLPESGRLTSTDGTSYVDANFGFELRQRNFAADSRLSAGPLHVDAAGSFLVEVGSGTQDVSWTPAENGRLADDNGDPLPDQHFYLHVYDPATPGDNGTFVAGVLLSHDTLDNNNVNDLASDLEVAIELALASHLQNIEVTITDVTATGFRVSAVDGGDGIDPDFTGRLIRLVRAEEFTIATIDAVTVAGTATANNNSTSDLVDDVQAAIDAALAAAGLGPVADPLLGFDGTVTVISDSAPAVAELDAPADGVLGRDVRFTITLGDGTTVRGTVRAADTTTNGSAAPGGDPGSPDSPVEALAMDVERALRDALEAVGEFEAANAIIVEVHPPLGIESIALVAGAAPETAPSSVPANGVLEHDVQFTLTTAAATTVTGAIRAHATTANATRDDLAADVSAAINSALRAAGVTDTTVTVGVDETSGRLNFAVSGADLDVDFSATPARRLQLRLGVLDDPVVEIRFENPQVLAALTGDRISLTAVPALETFEGENPSEDTASNPPVVLARRVGVRIADFDDPAYRNLGLLSSPVPFDGQLDGTATFRIVVDGTPLDVTVLADASNDSVSDLIDDINAALADELADAGYASDAVRARRIAFAAEIVPGLELELLTNRFEFVTSETSGIREISLPPLADDPDNTAISQLGFDTNDERSARVQLAEFFIRDAVLRGTVSLSAADLEGSALVGFGGDGGLGVGIEFEGQGAIIGTVDLALLNPLESPPAGEETRITLEALWRQIGNANFELSDLVQVNELSAVVDIDLLGLPVLLGRTPLAPVTVSLGLDIGDWLNSPPALDDASDPNGISVNVTGLDLSVYDALSNLTFSDVVDGLESVLDFLVDLQGEDGDLAAILDRRLPLLNQSPNELLVIADQFAAFVDEVAQNPARSLQRLESTLENLLGLPEQFVTLAIDRSGDALALRVDLVFGASIDESLGFDLDMRDFVALTEPDSPARDLLDGLGNFVGISSTGDLSVSVDGTVRLSFGIDLGSTNGSAEALGFRDGDQGVGTLTASSDAQTAADRLVDQNVVFELEVSGAVLLVTVSASEATRAPVEVDENTRISELATPLLLIDGMPELIVTLAGNAQPVEIDLGNAGDDPTIAEIVGLINAAGVDARFDDVSRRIELEDTSALSSESQSGVYVTLTSIAEFQALSFGLRLGTDAAPVNVTVDQAVGVTRKEWLQQIEEAIRSAMVEAGQLNPVADAVVAVAYNAIASGGQLTFQGTGEGFAERLTIYPQRGVVFSVDNARTADGTAVSNAGTALGLLLSDAFETQDLDADRLISGREMRTAEPADQNGFVDDVRQGVQAALSAAGLALDTVTVSEQDGKLRFAAADAGATLVIRSVSGGVRPFLYNGFDGTAIRLEAEATGENLDFTAQVGPFGFYVIDGSAELAAFFAIALEDTADPDGRTYFGDGFAVETDYGGHASASLPLYFPDESTPVDDFANALVISIERLQDFLGSEASDGSFDRTEGSVAITTPDLSSFPTPTLIGMLSNPEFVIDGLDAILSQVQDALNGEVFGVEMPLVGDGLAPAGQFIADFRDDVLGYLSLRLRQGGLNPVTLVQETLYNVFASEHDGDPDALLGFGAGESAIGVLQASGVLTSGALARDAAFNVRVGREGPVRVTVAAGDVAGDRPEDLVAALNESLIGRGLDDLLTAGYQDVEGGFQLTLTASDPGATVVVDTAGAISLDIFGLEIGALGLLQDVTGEGIIDVDDIVKSGFGLTDEFGQFDFLLGDSYTFSQPLDFDLGLPILEFDLDAGVQVDIGWNFAFGFGVSQEDGFYFVTDSALLEGDNELQLAVDVGLLGVLGFTPGARGTADPDGDRTVLTAATNLPADGRLSRDLEFALELDGELIEARVSIAQTSNNTSRADLAADIEAALNTALGAAADQVTARLHVDDAGRATGRLEFVASGAATSLAIYDRASAFGQLGFLALDVLDGGRDADAPTLADLSGRQYTSLGLTLGVDLRDPNADDDRLSFAEMSASSTSLGDILVALAEGRADVNLGLLVSFDAFGLNAAMLPAIGTDLVIGWDFSFDTAAGADIGTPDVSFEDVTLDLGTFITDFAGPFLSDLADVLAPLDFLLDRNTGLLYQRLPVISDLAGETVTLIDLAAFLDTENRIVPFIQAVEQIYYLANLVTDAAAEARANGGRIELHYGTLTLSDLGSLSSLADAQPDPNSLSSDALDDFNRSGTPNRSTQNFTRTVTRPGPGAVSFDILNPSTIIDLLLGRSDVQLITYDLPPFGFEFEYLQRFPIYPPLFATLRGAFGATVDLGFGFDTLGLNQFRSSGRALDLLNGFYVTDLVDGVDVPEVVLDGTIAAGASLDVAVASAGVEGGLNALIFFNLNDPNLDGRVRLNEMLGNLAINYYNPISIFDTSGRFDAFLRAYVEVLFGLWSAEYEIARVTLASFDIPFNRIPLLATDTGNGVLQLNIGSASDNRIHGSLLDGDQVISARYASGSVYVSSPGVAEQRYTGVSRIVVDGGDGNDRIDLSGLANSGIEIEMHGGTGNDTLIGAAGSRNLLFGDEGDDRLVGGSLADELDGGDGNDRLEGRGGDDLLRGGGGTDQLYGGAGADELDGGAGDDALDGGDGDDVYVFGPGFGHDSVVELTTTSSGGGGRDSWDFGSISSDLAIELGRDLELSSIDGTTVLPGGELLLDSIRHGLRTGDQVTLAGLGLAVPVSVTVTVPEGDLDHFIVTLPAVAFDAAAPGIAQRTDVAVDVESVQAGEEVVEPTLRVRTAARHGLASGDLVRIGGVDPVTGQAGTDGDLLVAVTVVDARSFDVDRTEEVEAALTQAGAFVQRTTGGSGLIGQIEVAGGVVSVTSPDHGLSAGDEVAIHGLEGDAAVFNGRYRVASVTMAGDAFTLADDAADGPRLDGVADGIVDFDFGIWQLAVTEATTLDSSVTHFGHGIEQIRGGRGGDRFNIYQTGTEQVVLDGRGGSDTYVAHSIDPAVGNGANSHVRLRDSGDFWDTDRSLFLGSQGADVLIVDQTAVTTDLPGDSDPRFEYGEPDVVLGFESGAAGDGELVARFALGTGALDDAARMLITIGDGEPTLVVVEPDDVNGSGADDLVAALNLAISRADLDELVLASSLDEGDGEFRIVLQSLDGVAPLAIDNVSAGSGIEAFEIDAAGGDDSVSVHSTNARTSVRVIAGGGDDTIIVGGPEHELTTDVTLRGIRGSLLTGPLAIDGGAGLDHLIVTARDETAATTGLLDDRSVTGLGMEIAIDYRGVETVELQLGQGTDRFVVARTIDGSTSIDAGDGSDLVTVESVIGSLSVSGGAGDDAIVIETMAGDVEVLGGTGDDLIAVGLGAPLNGQPPLGIAAERSLEQIDGRLVVSGGAGVDTLDIDGSLDGAGTATLRVDAATGQAVLSGLGLGGATGAGIAYDTMGLVHIRLGAGDDSFFVHGTLNDERPDLESLTVIDTGGGDDRVFVSDTAPARGSDGVYPTGTLDGIDGELWILGGDGSNSLEISDRDSTTPDSAVVITSGSVTGLAPAPIRYSATGGFAGGIAIYAGTGDDRIRVEGASGENLTSIYANAGDDELLLIDSDPGYDDGVVVVHGEAGDDRIVASSWVSDLILFGDTGSLSFAADEHLPGQIVEAVTLDSAEFGADLLIGGAGDDLLFGGPGSDLLSGGPGDDVLLGDSGRVRLEGGAISSVEVIDLFAGSGDWLAGGAMTAASRTGGDGNDVIIGGAGFDLLFGTLSEDILIFDYGRVRFLDGHALSVIVFGQRPLDLAAGELFDLYLKPALVAPDYIVPPQEPVDLPMREPETVVSTGNAELPATHHQRLVQSVSLPAVAFPTGSAFISLDAESLLAELSGILSDYPGAVIEIAGHTDSTGSEAFNLVLSQQRAEAVRDMLIELGVDPDRLRAVGYGESRPLADNDSAEGRERNRRVELSITSASEPAGEQDEDAEVQALGLLAVQGWRSTRIQRDPVRTRRHQIEW